MNKREVFAVNGVLIIAGVDTVEDDMVVLKLEVELVKGIVEPIVEEAKVVGEV